MLILSFQILTEATHSMLDYLAAEDLSRFPEPALQI
jgi:hypothetical protein